MCFVAVVVLGLFVVGFLLLFFCCCFVFAFGLFFFLFFFLVGGWGCYQSAVCCADSLFDLDFQGVMRK